MIQADTGLCWMQTATTGTGSLTLASKAGWRDFPASLNGRKVTYTIHSPAGKEIGEGTYTHATLTLARDTVFSSTAGGAKVALTGTSEVFLDAAAEDLRREWKEIGVWTVPAPSPQADIQFIPQDYGDLRLVIDGLSHDSATSQSVTLAASVDNGANWLTPVTITGSSVSATIVLVGEIVIPDYACTGRRKTMSGRIGATNLVATPTMFSWPATLPINALRIAASGSGTNLDAGTLTLMGR